MNIHWLVSGKYNLLLLSACWILTHMFCYFQFGILRPIDTSYYLENANSLLTNQAIDNRAWWYISYISLFALSIKVGLYPSLIILFQLAAALLSVLAIYELTNSLTHNKISGLISGLLMIIWFKFSQWNFILYTDSLFSSLVVLSVFASQSPQKVIRVFSAVLIVITALIRPTGVGFLFALLVTWYIIAFYNHRYKHYLILPVIVLTTLLFNFILIDFVPSFIESYAKGIIIYPDITFELGQDQLRIPDGTKWPLVQLLEFICYNPIYMMKSFFLKAGIYLIHAKIYYSLPHNAFIITILCSSYVLAIIAATKLPKSTIKTFAISFIVIQTIIVGLTSENWDGRFLLPILPWVFLLTGAGFSRLFPTNQNQK